MRIDVGDVYLSMRRKKKGRKVIVVTDQKAVVVTEHNISQSRWQDMCHCVTFSCEQGRV